MTKFLAGVAFGALLASNAAAADLAVKSSPPPSSPPLPISWTGFYIGAHVGAGWTTSEWTIVPTAAQVGQQLPFGSDTVSGFLGGAQIGANYQIDVMVFGVEGDFSWAGLSGQTCNTVGGLIECNSNVDRFATVTGRFGIVSFDRALFYLKAGGAWAHDTYEITALGPFAHSSVSANRMGWTAGGGIEFALQRNWSAKLEYDFMDFGTHNYPIDLTPTSIGLTTVNIQQRIQVVKFGLNYRFGWGG
jgi:outer membrane immunogenic protein